MKQKGFTLTELLIVVAIMSILLTIAGLSYSRMMSTYRLETQVRQLYADLMNARVQAMQKNRIYFVTVAAASYSVIEDRNDSGVNDSGDNVVWTRQLTYPSSNWTGKTATLNSKGLVSPEGPPDNMIKFEPSGVSAALDCINLGITRISLGKYDGSSCVAK